jgi:hypothetical protein
MIASAVRPGLFSTVVRTVCCCCWDVVEDVREGEVGQFATLAGLRSLVWAERGSAAFDADPGWDLEAGGAAIRCLARAEPASRTDARSEQSCPRA